MEGMSAKEICALEKKKKKKKTWRGEGDKGNKNGSKGMRKKKGI